MSYKAKFNKCSLNALKSSPSIRLPCVPLQNTVQLNKDEQATEMI